MDFRGFDSRIILINAKGENYHVHRGFPGKFEPSNLSRDIISREIGHITIYIYIYIYVHIYIYIYIHT